MLSIVIAGAMSVGPALFAQNETQGQTPGQNNNQQQADRPNQETMTGCLTEQQGSYMLATTGGDQVNVTGTAYLSKHTNHTVRLTGTKADSGGKTMLNVTKIEHVSASCSK